MTRAPIFIVGTERSGSNLLRVILTAHSQLWIPHPPHFMNYFGQLDYGSPAKRETQARIVKDMLQLIRYHIFPWSDYTLDAQPILESVQHPSMFGLTAAIYEHVLPQTGKEIWGCKSTFMIEHIPAILSVYPGARFIFLVRDPRDVALSAKSSVFSPCHPLLSARLWHTQQQLGIEAMQRHPAAFHLLHYEELLQDNHKSLKSLCVFLGIPLEPQMFEFFKQKEANKGAALSDSWKNTGKPLKKNNYGKWRTKLPPAEISAIESQCFHTMQHFRYEPSTSRPQEVSRMHWRKVRLKERFLRGQIEYKSFRQDKNVFQRWRRDVFVEYLRLRYGKPCP